MPISSPGRIAWAIVIGYSRSPWSITPVAGTPPRPQFAPPTRPAILRAAVEPAAELGVYAYDAYPILCALFSVSRLLSLDNGQRHAARLAGVALIDIETRLP